MKVIEVCLTVITIVEVITFIHRMVDFGLGLSFRKKDEKNVTSTLDTLQRLTFMITDLDSRLKELEKKKEIEK